MYLGADRTVEALPYRVQENKLMHLLILVKTSDVHSGYYPCHAAHSERPRARARGRNFETGVAGCRGREMGRAKPPFSGFGLNLN